MTDQGEKANEPDRDPFRRPGDHGRTDTGGVGARTLSFRFPERLGPFNVWIDESVYPERDEALEACRHYASVLEAKRLALGREASPRELADEEVVAAAGRVLAALNNLWEKIRTQSGVAILGESSLARQLVLASTVEWALEIVYQIRSVDAEEAGDGLRRWRVKGRAWRGEVSWGGEGLSRTFAGDDRAMSELALLEACARAYASCMATLVGWNELAGDAPPET